MQKIYVINGPNLNLLGSREKEIYGTVSLKEIHDKLEDISNKKNVLLEFFQSNSESKIVDYIQKLNGKDNSFLVINPAAFTHTSIAIRDALIYVNIPFIELHISNIFNRESFRKKSYFSDISIGVISGLGTYGYEIAMDYGIYYLEKNKWT